MGRRHAIATRGPDLRSTRIRCRIDHRRSRADRGAGRRWAVRVPVVEDDEIDALRRSDRARQTAFTARLREIDERAGCSLVQELQRTGQPGLVGAGWADNDQVVALPNPLAGAEGLEGSAAFGIRQNAQSDEDRSVPQPGPDRAHGRLVRLGRPRRPHVVRIQSPGEVHHRVLQARYHRSACALDLPIRHDGNGVDEMWLDRQFMQQSYAKSVALPPRCIYRILLLARSELSPNSPGVAPAPQLAMAGLKRLISSVAFSAGMNNIYFKYILSSSTTAGARLEGRVNDYVVTDNCLKCKYIDCVEV